jgi:hypothetical protein
MLCPRYRLPHVSYVFFPVVSVCLYANSIACRRRGLLRLLQESHVPSSRRPFRPASRRRWLSWRTTCAATYACHPGAGHGAADVERATLLVFKTVRGNNCFHNAQSDGVSGPKLGNCWMIFVHHVPAAGSQRICGACSGKRFVAAARIR